MSVSKGQIVLDSFSKELDRYSRVTTKEVPVFSEHLGKVVELYSELRSYTRDYQDIEEIKSFNNEAINLRNTIETSTNSSAVLFNAAKKRAIESLKNLTKEMVNGLKNFDIALK